MMCDDCIYSKDRTCILENAMFDIDDNCLSKIDKETYAKIYNKAIDDYRTEICKAFVQEERNGNYRFYAVEIKQLIADLGEQLKAGE